MGAYVNGMPTVPAGWLMSPQEEGEPRHGSVTFELDPETCFVLTEALESCASHQRSVAKTDPASAAEREQWASIADDAARQIEESAT